MQNVFNQNQDSQMAALLEGFMPINLKPRSVVSGEVIAITPEGAWVDLGQKADSLVSPDEVERYGLTVGDRRNFLVVSAPDENGSVDLSVGLARAWDNVQLAFNGNTTISARIKGLAQARGSEHVAGLRAEVDGLRAFIPSSQVERRGAYLRDLVGKTISVKVQAVDFAKGEIVLSQKKAAEETRAAALAELASGQSVVGTVTNVTDFGVFVTIPGGLSGLVHKSEITLDRSAGKQQLAELMPEGKQFELSVLSVDTETARVSLSLIGIKRQKLLSTLSKGQVLTGRVARMVSFGAFIELDGCLDGLLHNHNLGGKGKSAADLLTIGQSVEVCVLNVNPESSKVLLGLNQPVQA